MLGEKTGQEFGSHCKLCSAFPAKMRPGHLSTVLYNAIRGIGFTAISFLKLKFELAGQKFGVSPSQRCDFRVLLNQLEVGPLSPLTRWVLLGLSPKRAEKPEANRASSNRPGLARGKLRDQDITWRPSDLPFGPRHPLEDDSLILDPKLS